MTGSKIMTFSKQPASVLTSQCEGYNCENKNVFIQCQLQDWKVIENLDLRYHVLIGLTDVTKYFTFLLLDLPK